MRICITGGNFYGRGAEAMMLIVRDALRERVEGCRLCSAPVRPSQAAAYREHGIHPIPIRRRPLPAKAIDVLAYRLGWVRRQSVAFEDIPEQGLRNPFRASDAVVDISGFASGDQWGVRVARSRWWRFRQARRTGNKLVFMPPSWGPFGVPGVRDYTERLLGLADLVFAREPHSWDALKTLQAFDPGRMHLRPDLAFGFRPSSPDVGGQLLAAVGCDPADGPIIGLTPNMRIYERADGTGGDNAYVSVLAGVIRHFIEHTEARILLIPHEVFDYREDDRALCRIVAEAVGPSERLFTLPGDESAADLKAAMGHLSLLVASRYHSLVASLSLRKPVTVIGWSHKYDDLMKAMRLERWVVDFTRGGPQATVELAAEAWKERENIAAAIRERVPDIEAQCRDALDLAATCLRQD